MLIKGFSISYICVRWKLLGAPAPTLVSARLAPPPPVCARTAGRAEAPGEAPTALARVYPHPRVPLQYPGGCPSLLWGRQGWQGHRVGSPESPARIGSVLPESARHTQVAAGGLFQSPCSEPSVDVVGRWLPPAVPSDFTLTTSPFPSSLRRVCACVWTCTPVLPSGPFWSIPAAASRVRAGQLWGSHRVSGAE